MIELSKLRNNLPVVSEIQGVFRMSHSTVMTPGNKTTSREKLNAYIHKCYTKKVNICNTAIEPVW